MTRAQALLADERQIADDYRLLGLRVGAPLSEAKNAFRRLVKRWHPDVSDEPRERSEEETRRLYQAFGRLRRLGEQDRSRIAARGARAPARRGFARRGRDLLGELWMSRRQARVASRWRLSVATCRGCAGWGASPGGEFLVCPGCGGLGRHRRGEASWDLDLSCPTCRGHGCLFDAPCPRCDASGHADVYRVRLLVPGFDAGAVAYRQVAGQGHPGLGGAPAGDLYLRITIRDDASTGGLRS